MHFSGWKNAGNYNDTWKTIVLCVSCSDQKAVVHSFLEQSDILQIVCIILHRVTAQNWSVLCFCAVHMNVKKNKHKILIKCTPHHPLPHCSAAENAVRRAVASVSGQCGLALKQIFTLCTPFMSFLTPSSFTNGSLFMYTFLGNTSPHFLDSRLGKIDLFNCPQLPGILTSCIPGGLKVLYSTYPAARHQGPGCLFWFF